ncbi:hypothetical protein V6L77_11405 [Pannonibacter sp. Pt2-lr]
MILDRTVGTEQVAYAPITVRTGLAPGSVPAAAAIAPVAAPAATVAAELPSVRLPASKPLDLRPSVVVPGAAQTTPAFGSLFNGNVPASAVPRAKSGN